MTRELIPDTAAEALKMWDAGDTVSTVSMGGLGPGYEQAIHILVFEILRDHLDAEQVPARADMSEDWWKSFGADAIGRADEAVGGFSGAQVGAAKNLAYRYLTNGYSATVRHPELPEDRRIQVCRFQPQAPELRKATQ